MATITAAPTMYPHDPLLGDTSKRAKERLAEAARDFAPRRTIEDAVVVLGRGQRRDLG